MVKEFSGRTYTTTTGYNAKGELTSYTYPDGTAVGRSYTDRGELYQLTHAGTTIDTRYDNCGRMTSSIPLSNKFQAAPTHCLHRSGHHRRTVKNNGVSEKHAYNTDNTLASISFAGASIGNRTYGWDSNTINTSEAHWKYWLPSPSTLGEGSGVRAGFTVPTGGYDSDDFELGL